MAIRANNAFPVYQWTPGGFVFARVPDEAWVLQERHLFTGSTSQLEARMVEGRQQVNRVLHGAACDITWEQFYKFAWELCQKHNKLLYEIIPGLPQPPENQL
jgi:hypothetical protein